MKKPKKEKKPLSKATTALNEQLRRKRETRELAKRFLIVCEDTKSSPNYFRALKRFLNLTASAVYIAGSGGSSQPIQVVNRAIEIKQRASDVVSGTEEFDEVWCVIDGDYGVKIPEARAKAQSNGIELAISTMCFEYWVLLHFTECDISTAKCDGVVSKLKKHLPDYEKGKFDFSQVVKAHREACTRAEKLRRPGISRGDLPEDQNPCSEVFLLITAILNS